MTAQAARDFFCGVLLRGWSEWPRCAVSMPKTKLTTPATAFPRISRVGDGSWPACAARRAKCKPSFLFRSKRPRRRIFFVCVVVRTTDRSRPDGCEPKMASACAVCPRSFKLPSLVRADCRREAFCGHKPRRSRHERTGCASRTEAYLGTPHGTRIDRGRTNSMHGVRTADVPARTSGTRASPACQTVCSTCGTHNLPLGLNSAAVPASSSSTHAPPACQTILWAWARAELASGGSFVHRGWQFHRVVERRSTRSHMPLSAPPGRRARISHQNKGWGSKL